MLFFKGAFDKTNLNVFGPKTTEIHLVVGDSGKK